MKFKVGDKVCINDAYVGEDLRSFMRFRGVRTIYDVREGCYFIFARPDDLFSYLYSEDMLVAMK